MKYKCEVGGLSNRGDCVRVTLDNVRLGTAAEWREYGMAVDIDMPHSAARAFHIGRGVTIEVKPK